MPNPFETEEMAEGYATARPPVHHRIVDLAARGRKFRNGLDVGCGSGLSTAALQSISGCVIGMDPAQMMVSSARRRYPNAHFLAAGGEAIPLRAGSADVIAAAGSLNYFDLDRFFGEASRILAPGGQILVYDFSPGKTFAGSGALDTWFAEFERRYPWPRNEAKELNPEILAELDCRFTVREQSRFEITMPLDAEFYTRYMMTETNVAHSIRGGAAPETIERWCRDTLKSVFGGEPHDVIFRGYFVWMGRRNENSLPGREAPSY